MFPPRNNSLVVILVSDHYDGSMTKKAVLIVAFLLVATGRLLAEEVSVNRGDSRADVLRVMGEPNGVMRSAGQEVLLFDEGEITLHNGVVADVGITPESISRAEARRPEKEFEAAQREKGLVPHDGGWISLDALRQKNKQAKLRQEAQNRHNYPEDRLTKIHCSYAKTERPGSLPQNLVPRQGRHTYSVYIPRGYHSAPAKRYPCIIINSGVGDRAILEIVRRERWIAVIFNGPRQNNDPEGNLGAFLAAYDDAEKRFRISITQRFAVELFGRGLTTVYASLRKISGVIVTGNSFWSVGKQGFFYGFLKMNPELRFCGIFPEDMVGEIGTRTGWMDRLRIQENIHHYKFERYQGTSPLPPFKSIDAAFDWLKKEFRML